KIGDMGISIIAAGRKFKSENKLSIKEEVSKLEISCSEEIGKKLEHVLIDIKAVLNVKEVHFNDRGIIPCTEEIKIRITK
ncbi:MAG: hypothetical protein QW331_04675, partial [Candidatus Woesearchaeota archaeon]